ncbi:hypothetical protein [Anatilimnocola floriformis]|uniref:hypothetical protein n=1 Tax=Anatilimnocola floriformis TaxID=2948575 RepID=UPI0020C3D537|nr:hypothetical protein [Anatilimnocola floriformis]
MRRKSTSRVLIFAIVCLSAIIAARAEDSSVKASLVDVRDGKPPLKFHGVRLTIENKQERPTWIVLPYWGERSLPAKGIFPLDEHDGPGFGGKGFVGEGGSAVEVLMYGGEGFRAFRLPGKGSLQLDGYEIESWKEIDAIDVIEARELKVNGKTPLEKWLPYATTSDAKVKVGSQQLNVDWKNLDWDAKKSKSRTDYPTEKVEKVVAEDFRVFKVKIEKMK